MVDQLTGVPPTLFMRFLQFFMYIGDRARARHEKIDTARREAAALKPGTKVYLHCRCPGANHSGTWEVVRYNLDANDYKIKRTKPNGEEETDFAHGRSLELKD
jgi:hypothetical protein